MKYGTAFSSSDDLHRAPGTVVDAAVRRHRNVVPLATQGGTAETVLAAKLREGVAVCSVKLHSDQNLSAINFSVGTAADPVKYAAAQAGPNATSKELVLKVSALDDDALSAPEDIIVTPSGALPGAGTLVTEVFVSKR